MPLTKKIDTPETESPEHRMPMAYPSFGGFAEGFAAYTSAVTAALRMFSFNPLAQPKSETPRVGEFYADYSQLTPEEIAQPDPEADALFKRSKPISR